MKLVVSSLLVAFASSAFAATTPAQADSTPGKVEAVSPERLDLARRFVSLSLTADRYMESTREAFVASTLSRFEDLETDDDWADAEKKMGNVFAKIEPGLRERFPKLIEANAQAYAREYSAAELQQLILFAGSPAGQHYLSSREFVEEDQGVLDATQHMWEAAMPVMEELQKEMCAEKAAKRVAMGDTKAKCPLAAAAETQAG